MQMMLASWVWSVQCKCQVVFQECEHLCPQCGITDHPSRIPNSSETPGGLLQLHGQKLQISGVVHDPWWCPVLIETQTGQFQFPLKALECPYRPGHKCLQPQSAWSEVCLRLTPEASQVPRVLVFPVE